MAAMAMRRSTLGAFAVAGLFAQSCLSMYADDAGKLDWHRENLGRVISAGFDGGGGLMVVGEASTLASVHSRVGTLAWRRVLTPDDVIVATSAPGVTRPIATLSGGGRIVRLWSSLDGSLTWETALAPEAGSVALTSEGAAGSAAAMLPRVVSTEGGHVVVLSGGGIHVLSAASGAVLAQWWSDPAREPDLAALVGVDVQVTFTSLRLMAGGSLMAGGWSSKKGATANEAKMFIVAEIHPAERLVTFRAAKVANCNVNPSVGMTLAIIPPNSAATGARDSPAAALVGLCTTGTSLAVFGPTFDSAVTTVAKIPLPDGLLTTASADDNSPTTRTVMAASLSDLAGSNAVVLEVRGADGAGSAAFSLSLSSDGTTVSVVKGNEQTRGAWSCPPTAGSTAAGSASVSGGCALASGLSPSGKAVVASATMQIGTATDSKEATLVVQAAEVGADGAMVGSIHAAGLSEFLGQGRPGGRVQAAFLEVRGKIGGGCASEEGGEGCFRVLVVNEDDSAMMVGGEGVEWVREEALASVEQVAFVDSTKDDLSLLAESGHKVEHHIPDWKERMQLRRLEIMSYLGAAVKSMTGMGLPGADIFEGESPSDPAFGLRKLAVCSTTAGKLYALDMADGAIAWSLVLPSWANNAKILLHATRPKSALGFHPEVAIIALGEESTFVSWRDAITGAETMSEEFGYHVASALPLDVRDAEERSVLMLVDGEGGVYAAPSSPESVTGLSGLVPSLYHHNFSQEAGLQSFSVVKREAAGDAVLLGSAPVASMPVPNRSRVVAKAYADRRDEVQTPAHTLGDDSLLIKYINPRLLAMATLAEGEGDGGMAGKGQEMTVTVLDSVSGRILHRISHKGAAEPVHMVVSESWVVYSYWSAASQRTEISTLSLYEGMIDKYGLSPFNRPEWKESFSSFESRVPIVLQKSFVFPHPVTALGIILTQRGITAKDILVGTALGQVILLDRRFLDPRRPQEEPTKIEKEEKLVQYQAYLPVIPTQVLSYYKVVEGVDRVLTEPTGLESTSLVLALGLDLFGCRVAPSKTYDKLDPNFNYALLVLVLVAMSIAVLVSGRMSATKRLKDQWT